MPESNEAFQQIEKHRNQIDELDKQIVDLLNKRAAAKMGLFDAKREEQICEKIDACNDGPLFNENLREIYTTILKVMKETPSL